VSGKAREAFRRHIAAVLELPPDHVTLFARGRVALWAILRALEVGPADEVIVPAFTCVAVPNSIIYVGARPVWVDIDPATYVVDPCAVEAAITPRSKVLLAQNTFGLSADIDALVAITERHGLTVVDDCAHGFGGRYHGRPNGTTAPVAFFSTQWSKPVSTGLGGFAVARDAELASRLRQLEESMPEPAAARTAILATLDFGRERAGAGAPLRAGRMAYRWLSHAGMVPSSSSRDELDETVMPRAYLCQLSEAQARRGSRRIDRLAIQVERRRSIAGRYSAWLASRGRTVAGERADAIHAFLRYPLRVHDRPTFRAAAARAQVDLGDWFVSPVHPALERLDRWGYLAGSAPGAEQACREIVNLPTDPGLGDRDIERTLAFLDEHSELIQ
jgi:dTDP-4-amino-4,6-dideoxygalactose transaminase